MHGVTTGGSTTYSKLVCIYEFPDLGSAPESIDVTTLCDVVRKGIEGIEGNDALDFSAYYTLAGYTAVEALAGEENEKYSVWFGGTGDGASAVPTGSDGKFDFEGTLSVYLNGGGVNEAVSMTISIIPSSKITQTATVST